MRKTRVAIVGGGPSGLLLARLLDRQGVACVVLERHSRDHVERRIRAGLLEWTTVELLNEAGVGDRMMREGLIHGGFLLAFDGRTQRIDLKRLAGRQMLVYGQTELQIAGRRYRPKRSLNTSRSIHSGGRAFLPMQVPYMTS